VNVTLTVGCGERIIVIAIETHPVGNPITEMVKSMKIPVYKGKFMLLKL